LTQISVGIVERRSKMTYLVRVNGRVFEESKTEERKNEIVEILRSMYTNAEITVEKKRGKKR
jgi:hypothetical protein